jgi:hypothetical protein
MEVVEKKEIQKVLHDRDGHTTEGRRVHEEGIVAEEAEVMSFFRKIGEAFGMPPADRFSVSYMQVS